MMVMQMMFYISKPDVFKSPNSETYVILERQRWRTLAHKTRLKLPNSLEWPIRVRLWQSQTLFSPLLHRHSKKKSKSMRLLRPKAITALKSYNGGTVSSIPLLTGKKEDAKERSDKPQRLVECYHITFFFRFFYINRQID